MTASQSTALDAETGVLGGLVTRGPGSPVSGSPGAIESEPAAGVRLGVSRLDQGTTASVVTGSDGRYRLNLPAGTYLVTVDALPPLEFTKDLPATVVVKANKETRLDVRIDTGIR